LVSKALGLARESVKAIEKRDHTKEDKGEPSRIRLEGWFEDEIVARDVLSVEGGVEADVGDTLLMDIQVKSWVMATKFWNQGHTFAEPARQDM